MSVATIDRKFDVVNLQASDPSGLVQLIQSSLDQGYTPLGGPFFCANWVNQIVYKRIAESPVAERPESANSN